MRKSIIILSLCALLLTASRLAVGSLQAQRHEREFIAFGPVLVWFDPDGIPSAITLNQ